MINKNYYITKSIFGLFIMLFFLFYIIYIYQLLVNDLNTLIIMTIGWMIVIISYIRGYYYFINNIPYIIDINEKNINITYQNKRCKIHNNRIVSINDLGYGQIIFGRSIIINTNNELIKVFNIDRKCKSYILNNSLPISSFRKT